MKHLRAVLPRLLTLLILSLTLIFNLASCDMPVPPEYTASHLDKYFVPEFDKSKLQAVERIYRDYYVESLPDPEELAEQTAKLYFESFHEKIDTGNKTAVTDALLHCYVYAIGDRYSVYRTAEEYEDYDTDMSGSFYGIGVVVTYDRINNIITVTEVYAGGGAADAGIKAGDLIVGVDGESLEEIGYDAVVNKIRGEENTTVSVTIIRDGEEITLTATRKKVVEKSVSYSLDENKIGYIEISSFKDNTYSQFKEAIDYMEANGAVGIIYDLRSNPGGYLSAVVNILSYIAPDETTIVSFSNDYAKPQKDRNSHSLSIPSVVICNESTASAGELFTAAMRDFDEEFGYFEVTTVGVNTFGKGIMQSTFSLSDGSTVTLTVAYYNPPSGENYDGVGIAPDVTVEAAESGDTQLDAAYVEIYKIIK